MEYKESLKLYQELLGSSKEDEQSIIHAHIIHNINAKLIEKLDKLETQMDIRFDKIDKFIFYLKLIWITGCICAISAGAYSLFRFIFL